MSSDGRASAYIKALRHPEIAEYREERRFRTQSTREDYITLLAYMKADLHQKYGIRSLKDVDERMLMKYFNVLRQGIKKVVGGVEVTTVQPKTARTFNKYVSIARDYYYHHLRRKYPSPQDKHFEHEEVDNDPVTYTEKARKSIIAQVEKDENKLWRAVVGILCFGPRENDVCNLYAEHINKVDNLIHITQTPHHTPKRWRPSKKIIVPVNDKVIQWITEWIDEKKKIAAKEPFPIDEKDKPLLFIDNRLRKSPGRGKGKKKLIKCSRWGKPLIDYEVRRKFKEFLGNAGLEPNRTVHQLRSSYVMSQLDRGKKPHEILVSTGHSSTRSLDPYIKTAESEEAAKKLPRDMV